MASAIQIMRRRRERREKRHRKTVRRAVSVTVIILAVVLFGILPTSIAVGGAAALYAQGARGLPAPMDTISIDPMIGPTRLYDRNGEMLLFSVQDPLGDERSWLSLDDLPPYVAQATLVTEDPNFLTTTRFDAFQTAAKLWRNLIVGPLPPDSSLTGRLVRNTITTQPNSAGDYVTVEERGAEIALVAEINRLYSPQDVLEWHLNTNYYGNEAYGIEAASLMYLGKPAVELTLAEAALLAAITPAPEYNPIDNETAARSRQGDLLRAMLRAGDITSTQFDQAVADSPIIQAGAANLPEVAPDFSVYARRQAEDILNAQGMDGARLVARGGLRIITTLDLDLYYQSECALRAHLARLNGDPTPQQTLVGQPCTSAAYLPALNAPTPGGDPNSVGVGLPDSGALVMIDVRTGELRSFVGPALAQTEQPGPVLYPFVYFEGFRSALYTPATMMLDIPRRFPGAAEGLIYTPTNPDGQFRGPMNLRDAMGAGLLPPVVQVAYAQGIDSVLRSAHRIGLSSMEEGQYDLALLERGGAVSVLDVAYAYSVFASLGEMRGVSVTPVSRGYRGRDPVAVLRIEDAEGNALWEYDEEQVGLNSTPILAPELGFLVNDILSDEDTRRGVLGEDNPLNLSRPGAVVNGVTSSRIDNWTVGYTPQILTTVLLDREDGQEMTLDPYGLAGAAPVWRAVMEYVHTRDALPVTTWPRSANIVQSTVCDRSGLAPNGICPVRGEIFLDGTQPTQLDPFWQEYEVNNETGQLATSNTPAGVRAQRTYFVPPDEAEDWWRTAGLEMPPTEYDSVSRPAANGSALLQEPTQFATVSGQVQIRGVFDPSNFQFFRVSYGQGLNPSVWTQIGDSQTSLPPDNLMGVWDTTGLDGLYNLRLSVVRADNIIEYSLVQVTVDNIPPEVTLSAGEEDRIYRFPSDAAVELTVEAEDNLTIDRIEFYHNGQFVGSDEEWPYGFNWPINRVATEVFTAIAYDGVGNEGRSEVIVDVGRDG